MIKKLIPVIMLLCIAYMMFQTSCANVGMPTGGDKDTIPPELIKVSPLPNETNFTDGKITMTFNEFVISSDVSSNMLISPPLAKNSTVKMRGKTVEIDFNDQLQDSTTYSIDFRESIQDNNEGNPMTNFRIAFSTGSEIDTLELGGYVRMAENMEPMPDILVSLYAIDSLHYFRDSVPNYIAKTDEDGFFLITNIAEGRYRMYALEDLDNSLTYNSEEEQIAFLDTLISPFVPVSEVPHKHEHDSIGKEALVDSIMNAMPDTIAQKLEAHDVPSRIKGMANAHQHQDTHKELSVPVFLRLYKENVFDQYLNDSKRERNNFCQFFFDEGLSDSFNIQLIQPEIDSIQQVALLEYSTKRDSLTVWISDTTIASMDTLQFALSYTALDSMDLPMTQVDTLALSFVEKEEPKRKKKKKDDDEEEEILIPHFSFSTNAKSGFNKYDKLVITSPEPIKEIEYNMIHLYKLKDDSIEVPVDFEFIADSTSLTSYYIDYPWDFEEVFNFYIDSAAALNISERPSNAVSQTIKVREESYYSKISLSLTNVNGPMILEILQSGKDDEALIQSKFIESDGTYDFELLDPEKYIIRAIIDKNANQKWDIGSIEDNRLPEEVVYYPKIIKLRSNFEVQESWDIPDNLNTEKNLIDEDEEEKDKFKDDKGRNNRR